MCGQHSHLFNIIIIILKKANQNRKKKEGKKHAQRRKENMNRNKFKIRKQCKTEGRRANVFPKLINALADTI